LFSACGPRYIFFKTDRIDVSTNPPIKARFDYQGEQNGWNWGGWDYSVYELLEPTDLIKLNTKYLVIVKAQRGADITLFKTEHVVSWNGVEFPKSIYWDASGVATTSYSYTGNWQKTFIKRVSEKQFNLINGAPITTTIYELQLQHDIRYIIPGIFVVVLGVVLFLLPVFNSRKKTENRPPES
jgi:hypothetical protein